MIDHKRVLVVIPARGGSKGLPGKNIIEVNGKPLLAWPIMAALGAACVDKVIVSTDDEKMAGVAQEHGAEIPFMRPAELATDTASSISVLEHAITWLQERNDLYDYIVLLEPTSPLTTGRDIDKALRKLHANRDIADAIVGVCRLEVMHPQFNVTVNGRGLIESEHGFSAPIRRQDLEDTYYFEGSLYISDVRKLLEKKNFCHDRTLGYIVPKWQAFEIDDAIDLMCVRTIFSHLDEVKKENVE